MLQVENEDTVYILSGLNRIVQKRESRKGQDMSLNREGSHQHTSFLCLRLLSVVTTLPLLRTQTVYAEMGPPWNRQRRASDGWGFF